MPYILEIQSVANYASDQNQALLIDMPDWLWAGSLPLDL